MSKASPKIVVIGGGTGNFTVLSGLKPLVGDGLTAVVGMADDGGSTGLLRDEYGVLPPGDIRQCLVALSNASQETRELLNHRFSAGTLAGQSLGNLIITAAEQRTGNLNDALSMLNKVFDISGQVLPATLANRRLRITTVGGQIINGEHVAEMTNIPSLRGATISFDKQPTSLNQQARAAIEQADLVVIAPGDLYTSVAPALAVDGMNQALLTARKVVMVANLMNRNRHTKGFSVADYASEIERIVGAKIIDYVLYNTEVPDAKTLDRYAHENDYPVIVDHTQLQAAHYLSVGKPLLSHTKVRLDPSDSIAASRSLIRHDQSKVARALLDVYAGHLQSDVGITA